MTEPNPKRAEILKQALQPPKHVYATTTFNEETTTEDTTVGSLDDSSGESSSQESEFEDEDLEAMLAQLDRETAEEKGDFPPVPEGFPFTPVWLRIPDYKKGDKLGDEQVARVLIKLWNQGDHDFQGGVLRGTDKKIYPIYPDVLYVQWKEKVIEHEGGSLTPVRYIASSIGPFLPEFDAVDIVTGDLESKYPDTRFVSYEQAGYDPDTFLAEND